MFLRDPKSPHAGMRQQIDPSERGFFDSGFSELFLSGFEDFVAGRWAA
jgi:hypothetical protein